MDWLSRLFEMMPVRGRLDLRCSYGAPWRIDQGPGEVHEIPYHAVVGGSAVDQTKLYAPARSRTQHSPDDVAPAWLGIPAAPCLNQAESNGYNARLPRANFRRIPKTFLAPAQTDPSLRSFPWVSPLDQFGQQPRKGCRGSFLRTKALRGAAARGDGSCAAEKIRFTCEQVNAHVNV
jgi:hypothetical protein